MKLSLYKSIPAIVAILAGGITSSAQKVLTPPSIMIVPDIVYCNTNGYTVTGAGGEKIADYEAALAQDPTLHSVLTQIAQLIKERNSEIVIVDLIEAINNAKSDEMMAIANSGSESENIDETIIRNSNADLLVKVHFDLIKNGPQYQVSYTLNGTDPYTSSNFAPIEGLGKPSTAASPVALLDRKSVV